MNKKINIGVEELEEIEVGYDAAGGNMEVDQDEVPEGTLLFYDFVSSSSPLPVEDGHYDHIKYSHAWIWVDEEDKQGVVDEFYRVLSVGGTVFIRDYLARFDWEKGEEVELTHAQWMERLTTYFSESKWDIGPSMILADGFTVEITLTKKEESVNMENERRIGYVICPADMDVVGSHDIIVNDSVKKALDYAFGMCMFVEYPDYAVHEVSYLVSDISYPGNLINIVRVTENTKINFLFFGTEYQSQQDLDKMIAEEETVTKQDTKILDWFELMTLSQLEAFKSSIEDDKDSPLDVAAIEKDYQEWLRELPTMCQRIGADLHAIKDAVGIPNSLIK